MTLTLPDRHGHCATKTTRFESRGSRDGTTSRRWFRRKAPLLNATRHIEFGFDDTYPSGSTRVPPPLPPGWSEDKDPTSGQMYFLNAATGEATWEPPLAERWVAAKDKATGDVYYYEKTTGRSSWTEHVP